MARCTSCDGILARTDVECYICGEPIAGRGTSAILRWLGGGKPTKPPVQAVQRVLSTTSNPHRESKLQPTAKPKVASQWL